MNERDIAKLAALIAAGVITEDVLSDMVGGDDSIIKSVMTAVGATAIVGAASGLIEDAVDTTMDIVDELNPFKW